MSTCSLKFRWNSLIAQQMLHNQCSESKKEMIAAKPLAKRRMLAHKIGPLLSEARQLMHERDTADGLHEEHVSLRNERIYSLVLHTLERECDWHGSMTAFNILNGPEEAV